MQSIKNRQAGFVPFIVIAVVIALAVGGGVYVSKKNKDKNPELQDNPATQANENADANANINANLGINSNAGANLKGSLKSLLDMKANKTCEFVSTNENGTSDGVVYISADGRMRGDVTTVQGATSTESHMIVKDGTFYGWSGTQGAKMSLSSINASTSAQAKTSVDLNTEVDYTCEDWTVDTTKFTLPVGVTFVDIAAMLKGNLSIPGGTQ